MHIDDADDEGGDNNSNLRLIETAGTIDPARKIVMVFRCNTTTSIACFTLWLYCVHAFCF
jgi:hypothetical protein